MIAATLQYAEPVAEQQLAFTAPDARVAVKVGDGNADLKRLAFDKVQPLDQSIQKPRRSGNAASNARAPCPTPPLGRAGAGFGCQP